LTPPIVIARRGTTDENELPPQIGARWIRQRASRWQLSRRGRRARAFYHAISRVLL